MFHLPGIAETPIVVTWVTFGPTNTSQVQYWLHGESSTSNKTASGFSKKFVDPGDAKVVRYIHRVKIAATLPAQAYGKFSCLSYDVYMQHYCDQTY